MKVFKNIITLTAIGLTIAFTSCKDDRDSNPTLQTPTTFVLNTPEYTSVYDLNESAGVELKCSQPNYGFTAATNYYVQVSLDKDFSSEDKYTTLSSTYSSAKMLVDASELAVAQTNMALAAGKTEADFPLTSTLYVRLKAALANGVGEIYSNVVNLNAWTKFALAPVVLPKTMNVVGSGIGNWTWSDCIEMVQTYDQNGTFWHLLYFDNGAELKFNVNKNWDGGEFGSSATLVDNANAGLADAGGNLKVNNAGWYLVLIKSKVEGRDVKYTIDFEKPNVYLLGQTFGDVWDLTDEQLFSVPSNGEGYFVSPEFKVTGEVRMCVKIDGEDWWHTEFIVFADGLISYRATGGDQERYSQNAGKRAYLNFMTGKGYYE